MSFRKRSTLTAIAAIGLLAISAASASASIALRTHPTNSLLSGATTITNTSGEGLLAFDPLGPAFSCSQVSIGFDVTQNTSPTSIAGTLTRMDLGCGTGGASTCALDTASPQTVRISGITPNQAQVALDDLTLRCLTTTVSGVLKSCYYTGTSVLGFTTPSRLTFTNILIGSIPRSDSRAACSSTLSFAVTMTHLVQGGTNRTVTFTTS